jgi:hypothetical protein
MTTINPEPPMPPQDEPVPLNPKPPKVPIDEPRDPDRPGIIPPITIPPAQAGLSAHNLLTTARVQMVKRRQFWYVKRRFC